MVSPGSEDDGSTSDGNSSAVSSAVEVRPHCSSWQSALRACSRALEPGLLRVILPCAGWDAPCQALQAMQIPHVVVGAWETNEDCRPVLKKVHGIKPSANLPSQFHIGRTGDVTRVQLDSLPDADLLVSGPPCPPFSRIGKGGLFSDPRSDVLMKVLRWIRHLAQKSLRCFVLENVMGMLCRPKAGGKSQATLGGKSPAEWVIDHLQAKLGNWRIECIKLDSACTAQHRKRVYIVGYRCGQLKNAVIPSPPRLPLQTLSDIVRWDRPNTALASLSAGQRSNLRKYKRRLLQEVHDGKRRGGDDTIVALEIDRNPDRKWGIRVCRDHRCMCLRAGHDKIFLLSLGGQNPRVQRLMLPEEGAAVQGMSPALLPKDFTRRRIFKGLGNAMTVPVVGQAIYMSLMGVQTARCHTGDGDRDVRSDSEDSSSGISSSSGEALASLSSDAMSTGSSSS